MIRKVVLIDNNDSFTYNLAQYFEEHDGLLLEVVPQAETEVYKLASFDAIVISPGPGLPSANGEIIPIIRQFSGLIPILGVCLGMQAIYEAFGGTLSNLPVVHHGVTSEVEILDQEDLLFRGIPSPFTAGRYHSWVCDTASLPVELVITARDTQGSMMACRHQRHPTFGVQFHPESILTPQGRRMVANFLSYQPRI